MDDLRLNVKTVVALWCRGAWDALQLQRCVVLFVLDDTGRIWGRMCSCFLLNGCVYLGSLALYHYLAIPCMTWLLDSYARPVYGDAAVAGWQKLLSLLFQVLWLLPVYVLSLGVSCLWYQQMAVAAFQVKQRQQQQQQQGSSLQPSSSMGPTGLQRTPSNSSSSSGGLALATAGSGSLGLTPPLPPAGAAAAAAPAVAGAAGSSSGGGMLAVLEGAAQELFRVLLFLVFTVEVLVVSLLPFVGPILNVVFLCWLYAYYCFDYKWSLQGIRLPERLAFFERRWAFFGGFGFPCVILTVLMPFHVGAALCNLLFPIFVLVACESDPVRRHAEIRGEARLGHVPIFKLATWPTGWIIRHLFKPSRGGALPPGAAAAAGPAAAAAGSLRPMPSSPFAAAAGPSAFSR